MEKIWLKSYPPGVPAEINADAYQSLVEIFEHSAQAFANRPAFYNFGVYLTYAQLDQYTRDFAAYLQQELKLKKGDRVAIMLPNVLQYPIAMFGALRAGLIVVNVNPLYTADELTHQLNDAGAETIVMIENFATTLEKALPNIPKLKNIIMTNVGEMLGLKGHLINFVLKHIHKKIPAWNLPNHVFLKDALQKGHGLTFTPVAINNQDIAFLQYTGGTTGISKGVILTHRNLIANIQQSDAWANGALNDGYEILITALPLYHIFSLMANCLLFTRYGALNVLITNPRDIPNMVKDISKFKFTAITGVNTLYNALLKNAKFKRLDFSALHFSMGGGMALQRVVAENWKALTNHPLLEGYGLTETSPIVAINPINLTDFTGSVGLPISSTEIAIFDADGKEVGIGQAGELAVKGPQVMKGYWNNPAETAKVFTQDGWLLTGDIASIDEKGFIRLLERKKDMILVSGFNVYPNEIEDVLARLPGVKEVAVVATPDENSGEVPKVFIVKDDPTLNADTVIRYARQHLTPYKIPKYVVFMDELPKTNVGKILRRALRDIH